MAYIVYMDINQPISLPANSGEEIAVSFGRVSHLSHITSSIALYLQAEQICQRAKEAGILTMIGAPHSPGQIRVDLQALRVDIVFGHCHKYPYSIKSILGQVLHLQSLDSLCCTRFAFHAGNFQ